ncbi:aldo/keto reductase (plasmid) [Nicoliella spurrieriana]|uniref:Aldo/keto reductase n=1 Tax=Nicoliella spurrieriana TaxID=2925830 RepID=A0A976RQL3_9LACO|nr:aldo/keto reductase [Nicoliella spurrieriana]UQS86029.1 aldo/keto reductase [Nicoliella spurrieriana]
MTNVPNVKLNNGVEMPAEGFGVYRIDGFENCKQAVKNALSVGYRTIDTAQQYHNEDAVGAAIEESEISRNDIFITTKVWITEFEYAKTRASIEASLKKLRTDYIDLVLLHQPFGDSYSAYRALEDLYDEGKIRAIGVSNYNSDRYIDIQHFARIKPAVDQMETHVFFQQKEMQAYTNKYGTKLESWGPFANGKHDIFTNPILTKIGKQYQKTASQVALRFLTQKDIIIIPKSNSIERMRQNIDIWDFTLSDADMESIENMDTNESSFMNLHDPKTVEWIVNSVPEKK